VHHALLSCGAVDIIVAGDNSYNPKKRRTGEEIGSAYLLVKEAGGVMLDWNGKDLGGEIIGLDKGKVFHYITASTKELGTGFAKELRDIPEIVEYMKAKNLI